MIDDSNTSELQQLIQTISQAERENLQVRINKQKQGYFWTEQKGYAYLHVEGEKGFRVRRLSDLPFSRNIIAFFAKTLRLCNQVDGQEWVMLPCYLAKEYYQGDKVAQVSDVQVVVTGKIKTQIHQSPLDATIREIKEEIGFQLQEETFIGLGEDGRLDFVRGQFGKKVYPSLIRVKKVIKKHINFDHVYNDNSQNQQGPKQSIQSWVIVKNPNSPYFFQRKIDSKSNIGYIIALIQVRKLIAIICQLRNSKIQILNMNQEVKAPQAQQEEEISEPDSGSDEQQTTQIDEVRQCFRRIGSVKWQNRVKEMDQHELDEFIEKIKKDIWKLARNKYGNHLLNEICKVGDYQHRKWILEIMSSDLKKIVSSFYGTRLLQQLITLIFNNKQSELVLSLYNTLQKSKCFDQIAIDQNGSYFLRNLIHHLPTSQVVGIKHFYEDKNLEEFTKIISGQYSVCVMNGILVKLEIGCKQGVEGAAKRKKQFIKQLTNCFQQIINSPGVFAIERVYMILDPKQLEPLTVKILKEQENILYKGNKQYMKRVKKFRIFLIFCHIKYWRHPYYEKHYESICTKLTNTDIKGIMGLNFPNHLLRVLLYIHNHSLKIKIANVIFDMNVPHHLFEEHSRNRWFQKLENAKAQFEVNYQKTESGWVLRKDHKMETDLNILEQKHRQTRQEYLSKFSSIKQKQGEILENGLEELEEASQQQVINHE